MIKILVATEDEMKALVPEEYHNNCIITGMGLINAMNVLSTCMITQEENDVYINIGYAGSKTFEVGSVVMIKRCLMYQETSRDIVKTSDVIFKILEMPNLATCYTAHDFVKNTTIEDPCVFDMELAAYTLLEAPVYAIKVVSDGLDMGDYFESLNKDYREPIRQIIKEVESLC